MIDDGMCMHVKCFVPFKSTIILACPRQVNLRSRTILPLSQYLIYEVTEKGAAKGVRATVDYRTTWPLWD